MPLPIVASLAWPAWPRPPLVLPHVHHMYQVEVVPFHSVMPPHFHVQTRNVRRRAKGAFPPPLGFGSRLHSFKQVSERRTAPPTPPGPILASALVQGVTRTSGDPLFTPQQGRGSAGPRSIRGCIPHHTCCRCPRCSPLPVPSLTSLPPLPSFDFPARNSRGRRLEGVHTRGIDWEVPRPLSAQFGMPACALRHGAFPHRCARAQLVRGAGGTAGYRSHFVIMNDLFPAHKDIHKTYDLKGSTVGRIYPEEHARENPRVVLKDLNWIERGRELVLPPSCRTVISSYRVAQTFLAKWIVKLRAVTWNTPRTYLYLSQRRAHTGQGISLNARSSRYYRNSSCCSVVLALA
jgi:hypothetical protein